MRLPPPSGSARESLSRSNTSTIGQSARRDHAIRANDHPPSLVDHRVRFTDSHEINRQGRARIGLQRRAIGAVQAEYTPGDRLAACQLVASEPAHHCAHGISRDASAMVAAMSDLRETGPALDPKYDASGLVTAVVTDHASGELLMVAHMNAAALAATRTSGRATFWSRSRQALWVKGETSGHFLNVVELRIDCDQDAVWVIADPVGPACHTGERSCFYRRIGVEGLEPAG